MPVSVDFLPAVGHAAGMLTNVAVLVWDEVAIFELGVLCEAFGVGPQRRRGAGPRLRRLRGRARPGAHVARLRAPGAPRPRPAGRGRPGVRAGHGPAPRRPARGRAGPPGRRRPGAPGCCRCAPAPSCWARPGCSTAARRPRTGSTPTSSPHGSRSPGSSPRSCTSTPAGRHQRRARRPGLDAALHVWREEYGAAVAGTVARRMVVAPAASRRAGAVHLPAGPRVHLRLAAPRCSSGSRATSARSSASTCSPGRPTCRHGPSPGGSRTRPARRRTAGSWPSGCRPPRCCLEQSDRSDRVDRRGGGLRQRRDPAPPLHPGARGEPAAVPPHLLLHLTLRGAGTAAVRGWTPWSAGAASSVAFSCDAHAALRPVPRRPARPARRAAGDVRRAPRPRPLARPDARQAVLGPARPVRRAPHACPRGTTATAAAPTCATTAGWPACRSCARCSPSCCGSSRSRSWPAATPASP